MPDQVNKAELEFTASVNRPSFDAAETEVKNRAQRAASLASGGKPPHIADAEARTKAKEAAEKIAQEQTRAAEAARRLAAAEDAVYQKLVKAETGAKALGVEFTRMNGARFGDNLSRQFQITERQLAITRRDAQSLLKMMETPSDPKALKAIEREADLALKRVKGLEDRTRGLQRLSAQPASDGGGPGGGGLGGPGVPPDEGPNRRGGVSTFAARQALRVGSRAAGLPGIVGDLGGLQAYGAPIAGIGIGLAAIAGIRELIKLSMNAETAQINLAVAARNTGRSFDEAQATGEQFRREMVANKEEAAALAAAFGELQLKSGEAVRPGDVSRFAALANAQGLNPEDAAKALKGLAQGSKEAFEQLTGTRADLVLDRYARSIGTTTSKLTEMERVQALANEAMRLSGDNADLAALRVASLQSRWESFKNTLSDAAETIGNVSEASGNQILYVLSGGYAGKGPQATYEAGIAQEDARQIALNKDATAKKRREDQRRADEAERNRQQTLARETEARFDAARAAERSKPENFQAGLSSYERASQDLARLRADREAAQIEYAEFQKIKAQFAPDEAEKFDQQYKERIQSLTDGVRQQLDALTSEVKTKVAAFRSDILASTAEFTSLRLTSDRDNPYVRLFADAESAARKAQERFGLVGDEAVRGFLKAQEAMRDAQTWELRVKDSMSAVRLEFEAAELSRPFLELTGEMKRTLSVFDAEVKAALGATGLRANAEQIRLTSQYAHGFNGNPDELRRQGFSYANGGAQMNPDMLARKQFDRLIALQEKYAGTPGLGGEQIRDRIGAELGKLYQALSPRAKGEVARDRRLSGVFADAYDEQANFQEREVGRAAQRAEANRSTVRLAEKQLQELSRLRGTKGADDKGLRDEFLRITGELPREELSPALTKGRVAALQEEAQYRRGREKAADDATKATLKFQEALIGRDGKSGALKEITEAINARNDKVLVEVLDRTDTAKTSTLGAGFSSPPLSGGGFFGALPGLPGVS